MNTHSTAVFVKRLIDVTLASLLLVVFAIPMVLIGIAIKLDSAGPALFLQPRWGCNRKPFTILKFRTMRCNQPDPFVRYETLQNDPRITRIGVLLRKSSLDELPQFINVLLGTMSFVGPRPLVKWESLDAAKNHGDRFLMSPGLTGLAQVKGRNSISFESRLDFDVQYVREWSLWLDAKILLKTPLTLLRIRSVYPGQ